MIDLTVLGYCLFTSQILGVIFLSNDELLGFRLDWSLYVSTPKYVRCIMVLQILWYGMNEFRFLCIKKVHIFDNVLPYLVARFLNRES